MSFQNIIDSLNKGIISFVDLSANLKQIPQIVIAAVIHDPENIAYVPESLLDDYTVMLGILTHHCHLIDYINSTVLYENYDIVLAAVGSCGMVLKKIYDYEIIYEDIYDMDDGDMCFIETIIISNEHMNYIDNFHIVHAAVSNDGLSLEFASEILRDDFDIVYAAINQDGISLEFASERLRDDFDIVNATVNQNGLSLKFASNRLRNDFDIVNSAVSQYGDSIMYSSDELRSNMTIILNAVEQSEHSVWYVEFELRKIFQTIIKNAKEQNMKYFYDKIKDGTLYPCSKIWIQYLTFNNIGELYNWIYINMNDHANIFNVLFKSVCKLGYYDPVRSNILNFLGITHELQLNRNKIIHDIISFSE